MIWLYGRDLLMDFAWTPDQLRLRAEIVGFAQHHLASCITERDRSALFDQAGWAKCAQLGIQGLPIPEAFGGAGADPLTIVAALESLGYGCQDNGLIFSLNAHMWTCELPILTFGSEQQKATYLPNLVSGQSIGGNAMTEPESGSDAFSLQTTADRRGDRYVLNGSKTFVTNGPVADLLLVFTTVDRARGPAGITAFLVERTSPGLSINAPLDKMGLRTSPMAEVSFHDCDVPVANRLGKEGAGMAIFSHSMEWERSCILASAIGSMERQLEQCLRYAKQRHQFGQAIGKFQLVATKLVDMKLRLETARLLLYRLGWLRTTHPRTIMESSMVKLYISEAWVQSCEDAIQIHGGYGYMTDLGLERELRDAIGSRLYSGTSEIQRSIVGRCLGL